MTTGVLEDKRVRMTLLATMAVLMVCLLWGGMESHYRSCVMAAEARYPGVPVSALASRDTGPIKLSFVDERARAVDGCGRLPI